MIKYPLPPGCFPSLWQDSQRFKDSYLSDFPGYYLAGDGGYKDEDGFLYLLGRKDDIFKVGGEKVSINVIEQAITGFSAFKDFAVATYENEHMGEVPAIFYVLQENAPDDWKKQIRKQCRASLPKTHMPADMFEVEQIPRTSSGKVIRKKLKQSVNV